MTKHLVWGNMNLNLDDWEDGCEDWENMSEDEKWELIYESNNESLEDERINLDIQLNNPILVIADLGLWDGRKQGYKIIESGNIKDILYSENDYVEWYGDGYNIKATMCHHDGTNYCLYREIKNMDNIDSFLNKIYQGEIITNSQLNYYTKSIFPEVAKVYGWKNKAKVA